MKNKEEILEELQEGLKNNIIIEDDIKMFLDSRHQDADKGVELASQYKTPIAGPTQSENITYTKVPTDGINTESNKKPDKINAVDLMFYVAGIVLFSAIMSIIAQTWNDTYVFFHILLSIGFGAGLWSLAYFLVKSYSPLNDIKQGLTNAMLLTGSLSLIAGGLIVTNAIMGDFDESSFLPVSIMFLFTGIIHIAFDRLVKNDVIFLLGILLSVSSFPIFMFGILADADAPLDVWSVIIILSSGLLVFATRTISSLKTEKYKLKNSFNSIATTISLLSMYVASFGDLGLFWLILLIAGILSIFYLSIVTLSKQLLGNATIFLILTIITISFRYFAGYGVTVSLFFATIGLFGTAAVATMINRKYFK